MSGRKRPNSRRNLDIARAFHGHDYRASRDIREASMPPMRSHRRPAHTTPPTQAPLYAARRPRSNHAEVFPRAATTQDPTPSRLVHEDSPTARSARGPRKRTLRPSRHSSSALIDSASTYSNVT